MTANQINLKKQGFFFNAKQYPARSHCKLYLMLGRALPASANQAKFWIKNNYELSVLNADDVERVESLLNKHGFAGEYVYTKSGTWVRLQNMNDLRNAIRLEYISK